MDKELTTRTIPYNSAIKYLGSTGTQWIDTGISPSNTYGIKIVLAYDSSTIGSNWVPIGCRDSSTRFWINTGTTTNGMTFGWGNAFTTGKIPSANTKHEVYLNYLNSRTRSWPNWNDYNVSLTNTISNINRNIYLFMANNIGTPGFGAPSGRIYSCQITNGESIIRDFVPVRIGQTGYMYDKANPTGGPLDNGLYPNSGTGNFILGEDIPSKTINTRIKNKYDIEENWIAINPILFRGEVAYSIINGECKCKVGDGETNYAQLPFINDVDESAIIRKWNDND